MAAAAKPAETPQLEEAYERFKEPLLARTRNWFPLLRGMEADLYQSAWEALLRNGKDVDDVETYLERAVFTKGLDELRRRQRRPAISLERARIRKPGTRRLSRGPIGADAIADDRTPLPEEQVQHCREAKLAAELLDDLSPLQQRAVKLRWGLGVPRKQAAQLLGLTERQLKREVKQAAAAIAEKVQLVEEGRWCDQKRSLIVAYAFEFLSSGRAAKAEQHLDLCPGCKQLVLHLRRRTADVAAVAPLPALLQQPSAGGVIDRLIELFESARSALADLFAAAKHQLLGVFARAPAAEAATSQLAATGGPRGGGGLLAAVAACLVAGGGAATYCTLEGIPEPLRNLARLEQPKERVHQRARSADALPTPAPAAPESIGTTDQGDEGSSQSAKPEPSPSDPSPDEAAPSPAPEGSSEFGAAPETTSQARPAAAPSSGGGEFTP
jgi:RNA polymerase sigma factor (sigma-70 family)